MICPHCGYDNIRGADECAGCQQDLTYLDDPTEAADSAVERMIMEKPVRLLKPAAPICVPPDTPLREVIQKLVEKKSGCVLVMNGPELEGIFTERDLLMNVAGREEELGDDPICEWMTANPETVQEQDSVAFALHKMDVGGYRHLPMMKGGRPKGIISVRDLVRFLADYLSPAASG